MAEIRMHTKEELAQMPFGEVVDYISELYAGYYKYEKEALYKEDCLKDTIEHQMDEIVKLKRALEGYRNKLDEKEDYIGRLQMQITDMQEEIRELKEKLNKDEQSTMGYAPVNFVLDGSNSSYSEYAKHLMRKYEALTDSGFSHDDAMSLIPMWDDADFENFKKGN